MSRSGKFVVVTSVVWLVVCTVYGAHRTPTLQLISAPVALCFLAALVVSVVYIFSEWRMRRWLSLLPFFICVFSVVLSSALVQMIRHIIFVRSLPGYEAVVQQMKSGSIPVSTNLDLIPQARAEAPSAYAVFAREDTNGDLMVEFLMEAGFPVKHSGYLYSSSGIVAPGSPEDLRWPIRGEERPKWFYISD
jgi:hypothetical protein